jgi:cysteinyl-tRNA synthetase
VSLRLFDTATRELRDFTPREAGKVGMYICGLTTQGAPHIGHIRFAVAFDVLRRWLETGHGYEVTLVRNVTDIDDKVLRKAADSGEDWFALSYRNERLTTLALDALGVEPASYEPRATGHVPDMVTLMETLVEKGHAYPAPDGSGDVYFDVRSWPEYGSLSNQSIDDMVAAEDADPRGKRDPRDFALWKGRKADEPETASWPTPFGAGRPGWHLECSAMSREYLGEGFDIHGGGLDLVFPHHENEIAQSRSAGYEFARYWVHNGLVGVSGEKMSKSLGNSLSIGQMLTQVRPAELRYYLGQAHYRSALEFSPDALSEAAAAYRRIEGFVTRAAELGAASAGDVPASQPDGPGHTGLPARDELPPAFVAALDDDLAVPQALAVVHAELRNGNNALAAGDREGTARSAAQVRAMLAVLGLDPLSEPWAAAGRDGVLRGVVDALVRVALSQRQAARERKDYQAADAIRDDLRAAGVLIEDTPTGPRWELKR